MNKRRLLKLADLLEADAANKEGVKFDLTAWAKKTDAEGNSRIYDFEQGEVVPVNCSTAACAWGLAAISGAFKRQGVSYQIWEDGRLVPTFDGKKEFHAAEAFFGIDIEGAGFLFDPDEYPTSKTKGASGERYVAQRIRNFVAGKARPKAA